MKMIRKKLNSESGVSFLFALLAFMIAAMVSAVIIAAAVSALKSVRDDRVQEQAHLTLTSAAQLVEEQIDDKGDTDTQKTICRSIIKQTQGSSTVTGPTYTAEGVFQNEMLDIVKQVWDGGLASYQKDNAFSIETDLTGITSAGGTAAVNVSITASRQSDTLITVFKFRLEGADNVVYLKMAATPNSAAKESVTSGGKTVDTYTTTFQWTGRGISDQESDLL